MQDFTNPTSSTGPGSSQPPARNGNRALFWLFGLGGLLLVLGMFFNSNSWPKVEADLRETASVWSKKMAEPEKQPATVAESTRHEQASPSGDEPSAASVASAAPAADSRSADTVSGQPAGNMFGGVSAGGAYGSCNPAIESLTDSMVKQLTGPFGTMFAIAFIFICAASAIVTSRASTAIVGMTGGMVLLTIPRIIASLPTAC